MQSRKDRSDIRHALVTGTQPRDRLGKGRSQDDKVSTHLWMIYGQERNGPKNKEKEAREEGDTGR